MSNSRGFRIDAVEPEWYPARRSKRVGIPTEPPPEGFTHPRMRVFPLHFNQPGAGRMTISTPRLVGPCLIKEFFLGSSQVANPATESWEIGYAAASVSERSVTASVARPYNLLLELLDPQGAIAANIGKGFEHFNIGTVIRGLPFPLEIILDDPELFVTVSCITTSAGGLGDIGWIRVLENCNHDALRFFL